jgi:hypothetical protein
MWKRIELTNNNSILSELGDVTFQAVVIREHYKHLRNWSRGRNKESILEGL